MKKSMIAICLGIVFGVNAVPAKAAQIETLGTNSVPVDVQNANPSVPCTHRLSGMIEDGDFEKLSPLMAKDYVSVGQGRQKYIVCLDSPGGSFNEAIKVAGLFKEKYVGTKIEANARCESACALIFMSGTFFAHESGTYRWRILHPLGKLGFHAPSLTVRDGAYNSETVQKAYTIALDSVSRAIFELIQTDREEETNTMKVSLLGEMLRTPPQEMFYVENVDHAGRWQITVGPIKREIEATKESITQACYNSYAWRQDRSSIEENKGNNIGDIANYEFSFQEKEDEYGRKSSEVIMNEMTGLTCTVALHPGDPISESAVLEFTYSGLSSASEIGYLPPETRLVSLAGPSDAPNRDKAETGTPTQHTGTCFVKNRGVMLDQEPCDKSIEYQQTSGRNRSVTSYLWPSGAKTVIIQSNNRVSINGSKTELRLAEKGECAFNRATGNMFCYMRN